MRLVSADEMRTLDRLTIEGGTPGLTLMERAGQGTTRALLDLFPHVRRKGSRALICAGKGNNGGDGFVIARVLRRRGVRTEVVLLGRAEEVKGDAAVNLRRYVRGRGKVHEVRSGDQLGILAQAVDRADVIVDAIFGTGLNSEVRGLPAEVIELINASGVPVFAVDIPSGLNADTGLPSGVAIQAEGTATFGFAKIGHVVFPGAAYTGRLAIVDIGIAEEAIGQQPAQTELLEAADAASLLPVRRPDTHKGDCGHLLIIAGSFGKTGAARLASRAALRAGAGLVTLVGPASLYTIYATAVVEVMTDVLPDRDGRISFDERKLTALLEGKSALVVGPGIGTHEDAFATVTWLLSRSNLPIVLDADALTCISRDLTALRNARARAVLTPHPGEMARLTGRSSADVQRDRVRAAREFAAQNRCTLVLKGARTVIADPSSHAWINPTGNPGMASGGMGDVLSGMIGAFVAQGLSPSAAACLGVYTHGLVADQVAERHGEIGLIAGDLIDGLPRALASLRRELDV